MISSPETKLLELYIRLAGGVFLGWILGYILPKSVPVRLGQFLFWVGVPIGIVAFLRRTNLSGPIWIAPLAAWGATFLGLGLAWSWIKGTGNWGWERVRETETTAENSSRRQAQGSFLLASMVGNTGYLGYPITLALVGQEYFGWALFYDLLGSVFAGYGLGVALAVRFGMGANSNAQVITTVLKTPALWSFGLGLLLRPLSLPESVDVTIEKIGWATIAFCLVLIGMRLSQLSSWRGIKQASISLGIKMLLVPLILGYLLRSLGLNGAPLLVIVLQMAMPPAFATLIVAEAYNLDRDLAVAALAIGSAGLFFTLPIWLWLFGI